MSNVELRMANEKGCKMRLYSTFDIRQFSFWSAFTLGKRSSTTGARV